MIFVGLKFCPHFDSRRLFFDLFACVPLNLAVLLKGRLLSLMFVGSKIGSVFSPPFTHLAQPPPA